MAMSIVAEQASAAQRERDARLWATGVVLLPCLAAMGGRADGARRRARLAAVLVGRRARRARGGRRAAVRDDGRRGARAPLRAARRGPGAGAGRAAVRSRGSRSPRSSRRWCCSRSGRRCTARGWSTRAPINMVGVERALLTLWAPVTSPLLVGAGCRALVALAAAAAGGDDDDVAARAIAGAGPARRRRARARPRGSRSSRAR